MTKLEHVLTRVDAKADDAVSLPKVDGGGKLSPDDAEYEQQMIAARRIMKENNHALSELAK